MKKIMTAIRTFGRHPTLGEMKAYYNRDHMLTFLFNGLSLKLVVTD